MGASLREIVEIINPETGEDKVHYYQDSERDEIAAKLVDRKLANGWSTTDLSEVLSITRQEVNELCDLYERNKQQWLELMHNRASYFPVFDEEIERILISHNQ